MFLSRRVYLSLFGGVACLVTAANTVLSILGAVSLSSGNVSFVALPITASILDVFSLCCVALFSTQYVWKKDRLFYDCARARQILAGTCVLLSLVALGISLASVITTKSRLSEVTSATSHTVVSKWNGYLAAQLTIWALSCLSQANLYFIPLWNDLPDLKLRSIKYSGPRDSVMSEMRNSHQTTSLYMLEPTLPSSPLAGPSSPMSARSSQSLQSWRGSLHVAVRPVTSRTKLINRPSFARETTSVYSNGPTPDNLSLSHSDGFQTWDTSSVSLQALDAAVQTAPSRGTALEPIPGSRPVSPARALDGPFLEDSDDNEELVLSPPPKMLPDTSRPPSPAFSESHIHPLFRTESPIPPPDVTPGTSVIASPLATQMIPCPPRPYSRMRSNSRTASPSLLSHKQSFRDLAQGGQRPSRSPSPPSREMTPPIPDFVLNSSPRASSSASSTRRKATLQLEMSH